MRYALCLEAIGAALYALYCGKILGILVHFRHFSFDKGDFLWL
jgi:hypothetical protein